MFGKEVKNMKNKKGLSVVVGYVLLIVFGIALALMVFTNLKTFIPSQSLSCPDGVSIFLKDYSYNCTTGALNLTLENNGRFLMQGYIIYGATSSGAVANTSLSSYFEPKGSTGYTPTNSNKIYFDLNNLTEGINPGSTVNHFFQLNKKIFSIRILPLRIQDSGSTEKNVACGNAQITENLVCSS